MKIGIVDCGGANLNSIFYSFKRLNIDSFISNDLSLLTFLLKTDIPTDKEFRTKGL